MKVLWCFLHHEVSAATALRGDLHHEVSSVKIMLFRRFLHYGESEKVM